MSYQSEIQSKEFKSEDLRNEGLKKTLDDSSNPFFSPLINNEGIPDTHDDSHNLTQNLNHAPETLTQFQNDPNFQAELSQFSSNSHKSQEFFNQMVYMIHERNKEITHLKSKNKHLREQNIKLNFENEALLRKGLFRNEKCV